MEFKEKVYTQELPIYGYTLKVVVSTDINQSRMKRSKQFKREWEYDPTTRALFTPFDNAPLGYLFIPHDATIGEISHESTHAGQRIMQWIGAGYTDLEFVAYLFGYITDGVYDFVQHFKNYHKSVDKPKKLR